MEKKIQDLLMNRNKTYYTFMSSFFDAFYKYINADISKKSFTKIKSEYNLLKSILIATLKQLEKYPDLRESIDASLLDCIYEIGEVCTNVATKENDLEIKLIKQASNKFKSCYA